MRKFTKRQTLVAAMVLLAIALSIGLAVAAHKTLYHVATVDPGRVYRSGTLSPLGLAVMNWLHPLKTIVNVRSPKENQLPWHEREKNFCQSHGIKLLDLPLEADTPPTQEQIRTFLDLVRDGKNLPVMIHCHQGVTRTAMLVAVYEVAVRHKDNVQVFESTRNAFGHDLTLPDKRSTRDFILNLKTPQPLGM